MRWNFLLVALCSLVFARCSLLSARCSFFFCSLLVTFCSLLDTFCSLLVTFCSLPVNFCLLTITELHHSYFHANSWDFDKFFWMLLLIFCPLLVTFSSFLVNFCSLSITKLRHRYFPCKFSRFWLVFLDDGFQSFLNMRNHFQSCHKVTNIVLIDITLMPLLQHLDTFSSALCTWIVRSSRPEEF